MTTMSRVFGTLLKLPKPETRDVVVERDHRIPMRDGVVLLGDRWYPKVAGAERRPVLLCRTPYGRARDGMNGRLLAERGYQVVVVSCRGTFGSGGEFDPLFAEADDGQDVFAWLAEQPWCDPEVGVGTIGGSYVGHTQWAVAIDPPPLLRAIAPAATTANFNDLFYPGGTFGLATVVNWVHVVAHQELPNHRRLWELIRGGKAIAAGVATRPLRGADVAAVGHEVPWYRTWLEHGPDDEYWSRLRWRGRLDRTPPAALTAGWYDLFLPHQLADYEALRAAGRQVELTIGPWHHIAPGMNAAAQRTTLAWMDQQLRGTPRPTANQGPVRVFVQEHRGRRRGGRWVDLPSWPPPAEPQRWHLQPGGRLAVDAPPASQPDRYRYDPADPTPVKGGATLDARNLGPKDQAKVEARADLLTYTSAPLTADLTVVGPVSAELHLASEVEHTDVFVRLCDVDPKGTSRNVCDGIVRLTVAAGEPFVARVELFPTAITFLAGHRIRVQVASGAYPTADPNLGTGEPIATATVAKAGWREVHHDPDHPSTIVLPCAKL